MIGGNTTAILQGRTSAKNKIGENVPDWKTIQAITGFLDLENGDSKYTVYDAKIQESTHYFICDYVDLSAYSSESCRMIIDGRIYDVMLIDDPMGLHQHLEIYLKFVGGQP